MFVFIQNHDIGAGRAAVDACRKSFAHLAFLSFHLFRRDALRKGLQACEQLTAALHGIIRLNLEQRERRVLFELCVLKAIKIAEFDRVINDTPQIFVMVQLFASGIVYHAHARHLMQKLACIPVHEFIK